MPDYKELYLKLFRAVNEAAEVLISAMRECEDLYLDASEPEDDRGEYEKSAN